MKYDVNGALVPFERPLAQRSLTSGELLLELSRKRAERLLSQPPPLPFAPHMSDDTMSQMLAMQSGVDVAQTLIKAHRSGEKADLGALGLRLLERFALAMALELVRPARA